jgi:cobalt-zinc-cadmium efflux system membrane fusion protein
MLKKIVWSSAIVLFSIAIILLSSFVFYHQEADELKLSHESENEEDFMENFREFEEIAHLSCEHEGSILECNICRYEVGVVKANPLLFASSNGQANLIGIEKVQQGNPVRFIEVVGEIQADPNKILTIRSKASGVISSIKVDLGQNVRRGQMLFEMDSNEYRELHLEFLRLKALLRLAEKNFERENRLFRKKLTTEKEFLEAQSEVERINIEIDTTARKLRLMGLSEEEIKELPNHTEFPQVCSLPVRSPLNGIVVSREVTPGELVEANASLATIADYSTLWVWIDIYEKDLGILQSAFGEGEVHSEISNASYPDQIFLGKLDYLADQMDKHTRTIKARIVLPNKEKLLKVGMFVTCKLIVPIEKPTLIIPQDSLLKDGDENFVFKQVGDDLFFKQAVQTGQLIANNIEILQGLQENERIVTRGAFTLKSDVLREKMGAGCAD